MITFRMQFQDVEEFIPQKKIQICQLFAEQLLSEFQKRPFYLDEADKFITTNFDNLYDDKILRSENLKQFVIMQKELVAAAQITQLFSESDVLQKLPTDVADYLTKHILKFANQ